MYVFELLVQEEPQLLVVPELEQLECENKARALFSAAEEALRYAGEARIGQ